MFENERLLLVGVVSLLYFVTGLLSAKRCEYRFNSTDSLRNGTFTSPGWPERYPDNIRCIYRFVAKKNEKVEIRFSSFNVQGIRPKNCESDYLDIYTDIKEDTNDLIKLIDISITGRFCSDMLATFHTPFISTHSIIIMHFYTDQVKTGRGFNGTFRFIDNKPYNIGTRDPNTRCSYTIDSLDRPRGYIVSPTYPGVYPDNLWCTYKLVGDASQRIKLTFNDFQLFYGGIYCPYDFVKIYDGPSENSEPIGTFCGTYNDLPIYSSKSSLYLVFVTRKGRTDINTVSLGEISDYSSSRKGFKIKYEFRSDFVNLDFIKGDAKHLIGTECDLRIMSRNKNNGTIFSPNYPKNYPINVVCHYFIDGMIDDNTYEKVELTFGDFLIPGSTPDCYQGYIAKSEKIGDGKEVEAERFCGDIFPPKLHSQDTRLVLLLNTVNGVQGRGFIATYIFRMNYGIDGQQLVENECKFYYKSTKKSKVGYLKSPWHPRNYPPKQDCVYILSAAPDEYIHLSFDVFNLPMSDTSCEKQDFVEINEYTSDKESYFIGRFCGSKNPGPIVSSRGFTKMRMRFHSDGRFSSMGFMAFYQFVPISQLSPNCVRVIQSNGSGGVINSPNYDTKYLRNTFCMWTIRASLPTNRILVQFPEFKLEDCAKSVVRLYMEAKPEPNQQICGNKKDHQTDLSYESSSDFMNISFISAHNSIGADGFMLSWTEIHNSNSLGLCQGFKCKGTEFCIDARLRCNGIPNCGRSDNSDEEDQCPTKATVYILHIAVGATIAFFLLLLIVVVCVCCYRRKQCRQMQKQRKHFKTDDCVEVRYVSPGTTANTSDHLLAIERPMCQKVSIV